jgi:DNA-binding CsgD family transcriptional regulator
MSFIPQTLVGALIDSVSDDGAFAEFSSKLAKFAGTATTQLQIHRPTGATTMSSYGISDTLLDNYGKYFWKRDLWAIRYVEAGLNIVTPSEYFIKDSEFAESEIYNDLLINEEKLFRCLGFAENIGDGSKLLLGMHRTRTQELFEPELVSAMRALHPNIVHLIEARRRIAEGRGRIAEHLVDGEADATMVVSRTGELKFANPSARLLLEANGPLLLSGGRLTSNDAGIAAWLRGLISDAVAGRGGGVRSVFDGLGISFRLSVDRLEGTNSHLTCVRVRDEQATLNRKIDAARVTFRFTLAEACLAEALLKGATPAHYAITRGVRIPTVRSQLRSLFAKTGVTGQSELLIALNSGVRGQSP